MSKNDNEYMILILERSLEMVEYILKHSLLDDEYEDMLCEASLRAKKEEEEYIKEANRVTVNELKEALKKDVDIDTEKAFIVSKMDEEHLSILNKIADERNATKFIASKLKNMNKISFIIKESRKN